MPRTIAFLAVTLATVFATSPAARAQEPSWRASGAEDRGDARAVVELLADVQAVAPGRTFRVGIRFALDPGWHVYWHNPGDGAMATDVEIAGEGVEIGGLRWPTPERFEEAGFIVTYGYSREVVLLADATVSPGTSRDVTLTATADFLVCEVECIPDRLTVTRTLAVTDAAISDAETGALFARYDALVPQSPSRAAVEVDVTAETPRPGERFAAQVSVRCPDARDCDAITAPPGGAPHAFFPARIEGIRLRPVAVRAHPDDPRGAVIELDGEASRDQPRGERSFAGVVVVERRGEVVAIEVSVPFAELARPKRTSASTMPLWQVLLFAFIGGAILNLMPCVLPVLAIKAFGLARLAGAGMRPRAAHAGAYAAGILASMAALAATVTAVRAAGTELGWGFQLQEPLFLAVLAAVLVVFALLLAGVFEVAVPATALAARVDRSSGLARSAGEGVLAVVVATPCTAPFLGSAVGFALASDAAVIFAVFLAVGVGLAAPFVILVLVPASARFLPRPGPWMDRVKVVLAFTLLATVVWLAWLLGRVSGPDAIVRLLAFLLAVALATWIAGTWALGLDARRRTRAIAAVAALAIVGSAATFALRFDSPPTTRGTDGAWSSWSPAAVEAALAEGRVVFVDFTADWCITCKVNEALVLGTDDVAAALAAEGVAPFKADWTRRDDTIRRELARHGRAGVPMYLVISPHAPEHAEVLPEVLTERIVLDALRRASARRGGST